MNNTQVQVSEIFKSNNFATGLDYTSFLKL